MLYKDLRKKKHYSTHCSQTTSGSIDTRLDNYANFVIRSSYNKSPLFSFVF